MYDITSEIAHNSGEPFQDSFVKSQINFELNLNSSIMYDFTSCVRFPL